jgi:hypothetical protein
VCNDTLTTRLVSNDDFDGNDNNRDEEEEEWPRKSEDPGKYMLFNRAVWLDLFFRHFLLEVFYYSIHQLLMTYWIGPFFKLFEKTDYHITNDISWEEGLPVLAQILPKWQKFNGT